MTIFLGFVLGVVIIAIVYLLSWCINYLVIKLYTKAYYSKYKLLNKIEPILELFSEDERGTRIFEGKYDYSDVRIDPFLGFMTIVLTGITLLGIWFFGTIFLVMFFKMGTFYHP